MHLTSTITCMQNAKDMMCMSSPKPAYATGGSPRDARRRVAGARSRRIGSKQSCSPRGQSFLLFSKASKTRSLSVSPEARSTAILCKPVQSKTRTYHGRVGSERPAERPGGFGQDCVPTELFAQETKVHRSFHSIEEHSLQRLPRNTNKRIRM